MGAGPIFCDVDGVLTDRPNGPGGAVYPERIARLKQLIKEGYEVILWSGGGTPYARGFAVEHGLECVAIGKPWLLIDDNPRIRSPRKMKLLHPTEFFPD